MNYRDYIEGLFGIMAFLTVIIGTPLLAVLPLVLAFLFPPSHWAGWVFAVSIILVVTLPLAIMIWQRVFYEEGF